MTGAQLTIGRQTRPSAISRIRITVPTFDFEPFKARIARFIGLPAVLPGRWYQ